MIPGTSDGQLTKRVFCKNILKVVQLVWKCLFLFAFLMVLCKSHCWISVFHRFNKIFKCRRRFRDDVDHCNVQSTVCSVNLWIVLG